jgi:hypothetical protein
VLETLEFGSGATRALDALLARLTTVKGCLAAEERRRHHRAAMTAVATENLAGMERHTSARAGRNDEVMFDIEVDPVLAIVAGHREVVAIACGDPHNVPAVVVGLHGGLIFT